MKRGRPMLEETKIKNEWERLFHLLETTHAAAEKKPEDPVPYYDFASLMDAFFSLNEFEGQLKWRKVHDMNKKQQKWLVKAIKGRPEKMVDLIDLYGNSLKIEAPYDFDQYMLYMEFDRSPEEKFYLPRRKQLKPFVDAIQDLEDDRLDELFTSCPPRIGKALANDTPILTTAGWKNHGDLVVGDELFCPDGTTTKVIAVHPKCAMTHTVTFTDGTSIDCHFRHEWLVYNLHTRKTELLETQALLEGGVDNEIEGRGHKHYYLMPIKQPLQGIKKKLPVAPYTLGAWLGDGSNQKPRISNDAKDAEVISAIVQDGYSVSNIYVHKTTGVIMTEFSGLRADLQKVGMCQCHRRVEKYIPEEYLTASIEQRLELLAGLLDTDGCARRKEGRYDFSTTEKALKDGVISLVSTFGWRVCVVEKEPHTSSFGIVGRKNCWVVSFNPTLYIPCRLERKRITEFRKPRRIAIKSIKPIERNVMGNCITVEKDGMYLAGNRLMPTHNTTLADFALTWVAGKHPCESNLYSSCSDTVTKVFYNGLIELIKDTVTYHFDKVFPNSPLVKANADYQTINLLRNDRYPTITCRSIDGTLNGACDCSHFQIGDDLCKGIEQAMNKDVMMRLWQKVQNDFLTRGKQGVKRWWIGTRWSLIDPAGVRQDMLSNDPNFKDLRWKVINIPALDENEESNFHYKYGVGFDSKAYKRIRAGFERNDDLASWSAQYMGKPIEREGSLFSAGEMRFYNGVLPEGEPNRIFIALDPSWGGGDYCAGPVCVQFGDDIYIPDVVYTNEDKRKSLPMIGHVIRNNNVRSVQIEANKMTEGYADELRDELRKMNIMCTITTKPAPPNMRKEDRIRDRAPEIRGNFIFLESGIRTKTYQSFMDNVFSFTIIGKNKHDDAPDSLSMAADMVFKRGSVYAQVFKRFI